MSRAKEVAVAETRIEGAPGSHNGRARSAAEGEGNEQAKPAALGGRLAGLGESVASACSRSRALDRLGEAIASAFGGLVPAGRLKDLLSGTWLGHTAHPMLTDLPLGAWTSAVALDVFAGPAAWPAATTLVGLGCLSSLPTALTGLSELADLGTPEERGLAAAHLAGNLTALSLFGASYLARKAGAPGAGRALALVGAGVMTAGAYLGGHLSLRKGVGVNHVAFEPPITSWTPVMAEQELPRGEARAVDVGPNQVMLYRSPRGSLLALANRCSHAGGPLSEGSFEGGRVTCPWHGSVFEIDGGSLVRGPATAPQPCYETRVHNGTIEVRSRPA
jgi:nitrite reductase/ring-hydroxylating ferredoxin subunit/uncharacterized membrane protein